MHRYLGLMSGTSVDGIDAVIARFEGSRFIDVEASSHRPHPASLRTALIALARDAEAKISLAQWAALDVAVADEFAAAALAVVAEAGLQPADIRAIGSHGQTVFHDPAVIGSSLQIGDPNRIAARTGIPVAADFRRMDVALGGQGAPLVPAFHQAVFQSTQPTVVVNIGGIANVTLLGSDTSTLTGGYDCGPGNALMDEWALRHIGTAYDADGRFAAQGQIESALLAAWLAAPYFHLAAPKSTGRHLFNLNWADATAPGGLGRYVAANVQATLCELTARTVAQAVPAGTKRLLVCGGGAFNAHLMQRLAALLPQMAVDTTASADLPPQWVEATAFAWLACQRVHQLPGNLPSVTGASRLAVLGGLYG